MRLSYSLRFLFLGWFVTFLPAVPAQAAQVSEVANTKDLIKQAGENDNANGARVVCGLLNQVLGMADKERTREHNLREWEELANDCQDLVSKMKSPEALKVLVSGLPNMSTQAQAIILMGLKEHPADKELDEAVLKLLDRSGDFQVQVACMELLGAHPMEESVEPVLKRLKVNNLVSVQIAACRALGRIQSKKAVGPLIAFLEQWKGSRMRYEATAALRAITDQKFNLDASTWKNWWDKNEKDFVPSKTGKLELNYELTNDPKEELSYYEVPLVENRIVFLFDTSGSMNFGGKPCRMDKARDELKALITRLTDRVLFNIILFNTTVHRWQTAQPLVPANEANRKAALAFLDQATPKGGTMTISAMEEALRQVALLNGVETIFLLTDGVPNPMRHSGVKSLAELPKGSADIRRRIKFINETLKVRVNTIGVYTRAATDPAEPEQSSMKSFLEGLATDNDGVYKEVQ